MIVSLALGQSYDCPSASEATLEDRDEIIKKHKKVWNLWVFFLVISETP